MARRLVFLDVCRNNGNKANIRTVLKQTDPTRAFEQMLADLSARFINLPAAEVDNAINNALRRIAEMLGCDRSQLIGFSAQGDEARITHSGAVGGVPRVPVKSVS